MADLSAIETGFREAIRRLDRAGRLLHGHDRLDPHLEVAAFVKRHDGDLAFFFERVGDSGMPVCANLLASHPNVLTLFGLDTHGVRAAVERGTHRPLAPRLVEEGPCQEVVVREGIALGRMLPVPHHMPGDAGRFITAGVVIARAPRPASATPPSPRLQPQGGATRPPSISTSAATCASATARPSGRASPSPSPW
jgi:2,5-furandicarboxylate decarboxylase 1